MRRLAKIGGLIAILALLPAFGTTERLFAPGAKLWKRWQAHDAGSAARIDHGAWDAFLKRHVARGPGGVNLVNYAFNSWDDAVTKAKK